MENGIANRGNQKRLKQLMKRARAGERLNIGFIGGSITQGSLATAPEYCYAYHVFKWWQETFPNAVFHYINAGIGGTTSKFGVARVQDDLLRYDPDFVIIEFSVNDDSNEHFLETYEGLVRKVYHHDKKPAVLLVHNVYYDTGGNAQIQHARIGRYYQLPSVSMQSSIFPEVVSGVILNRDITEDDLHPNDRGHELVASVITYFLDRIMEDMDQPEEEEQDFPEPLTKNRYECSRRFCNADIQAECNGFKADQSIQESITDCFKKGWTAKDAGAGICFVIEGTGVSIQYRKSVKGPAPTAKVVIDGKEEEAVYLDGNFSEDWGDKLELTTITEQMEPGSHRVEITLMDSQEVIQVPFYLVSIIIN